MTHLTLCSGCQDFLKVQAGSHVQSNAREDGIERCFLSS